MKYIVNAFNYNPSTYDDQSLFTGAYDEPFDIIPVYVEWVKYVNYNHDHTLMKSPLTREHYEELKKQYHVIKIYLYDHSERSLHLYRVDQWDTTFAAVACFLKKEYTLEQAIKELEGVLEYENYLLAGELYALIENGDIIEYFTPDQLGRYKEYEQLELRTVERYFSEEGEEVKL